MQRIFRLYKHFWALEMQKQLLYQPVMAIFSYLAHLSWVMFSFVFLFVISSSLATQTQTELLLFLSYFHTVKGIFWIHSSWSSAFLAGSAFKEGKIDFHLLRPLSSQWMISSFRPNIFAIADLLIGLFSFVFFLGRLELLNFPAVALYLVSAILSAVLLYSIWFSYLTFFVPSGEASAVHAVLNLFWVFGEYPISIYSGFTKLASTVIFPVVLITTLPMSYLIGQQSPLLILVLSSFAAFSIGFSSILWGRMLRSYASAN